MSSSVLTRLPPDLAPVEKAAQPCAAPAQASGGLKRPRSIIIFSSIFYPHIFGGAEIAAYNRVKLLARRGYDVSVVTVREQNAPPAWGEVTADGYRLYRIATPRRYTLFERHHALSKKGGILWHLQDYFDVRNRRAIRAVLDEVRPDHAEIDNLIGLGFNVLSEIGSRDIPVTYVLHDLNLACFKTGMFRNGRTCARQCLGCRPVARLRQAPFGKIARLGFISPSRANLERARQFIPAVSRSLSCVIRNVPEDLPALPERTSADHVRLLYAGRLDPVKGIAFLLRVLDRLSGRYNFHLTVLGTGPSEEELRARYGREKWVTFRGFVPGREVTAALASCDLVCTPSLVHESYGLVTAQALQLGIPVIGSNAGGTAELVRHDITGKLVTACDAAAWESALGEVFENMARLKAWRKNAADYAHEFNEDVIGQAHEDFIIKLSRLPASGRRP